MRREIDLTTGEELEFPDAELPPAPAVASFPYEVSRAQGLMALHMCGYMPDVQTYFTPDKVLEKIAFDSVTVFAFESPLLQTLAFDVLKLTKDQLADLFRFAGSIVI